MKPKDKLPIPLESLDAEFDSLLDRALDTAIWNAVAIATSQYARVIATLIMVLGENDTLELHGEKFDKAWGDIESLTSKLVLINDSDPKRLVLQRITKEEAKFYTKASPSNEVH